MTNEISKRAWKDEWDIAENIEATASPIGKFLRRQRLRHVKHILETFNKDITLIDMGCGAGSTLKVLRNLGFKNSIGIDYIAQALIRCEALGFKIGTDVFNMDAVATTYEDKHFDMVFEEGLWEHFEDPEPFVIEAARIAKTWMLIIQPNHFTPLGSLLHRAWILFGGGGVFEYSFHMNYFIKILNKEGFEMVDRRRDIFWAQDVILFRRY